ncbi:hypothetical protein BRAS3843_2730017 [Bradyrhizobium sp. STM 3843]|nr:hypothetical protein BRAS3843_2730017 [Bradyrhizobium sp. STM 3843]
MTRGRCGASGAARTEAFGKPADGGAAWGLGAPRRLGRPNPIPRYRENLAEQDHDNLLNALRRAGDALQRLKSEDRRT